MNTPSVSSIKTDISDFCQAFAGILKPFAKSLESVRANIQGKGDAEALQRPLAGFSEVHHRLESLVNKVEQQQAYLIIFGPLKSGKSTLMNAISAAYVSEVTSLPAYPCLVHVKHGEDTNFVASRYSGEKLRFADNAALQALIKQSHATLAVRLREVEEAGEKFDPAIHYPEAIRRVEVAMPARNLKDSLTVLVDTPGLYTRMKFGYDLMTREFRNSAACAVFVVKTDNLFLEQVFEEFNELLDLFSRIFIVVNIDANKRDLGPDGSLQPSIESKSPGEVIRAFESLVMSAPLRRAQEAGRLKIYPIDLLNSAAAAMLRAKELPATGTSAAIAPVDDAPAAIAPVDDAPADIAPAAIAPVDDAPADIAPALPPLPVVPSAVADMPAESSLPVLTVPQGAGGAAAPDEGKTSVMPAGWTDHPEASFALFLKDLTEYLNSSDYLLEFMGDALLMGTNLGAEVQEHCSEKSTAPIETCRQTLQTELADTETRLAAIEKLESLDVKAAFVQLRNELQNDVVEASLAAAAEARRTALKQLEDWFGSDRSVAALQREWATLLAGCGTRVSSEFHLKARSLASGPFGGIRLDDALRASASGLAELLGPVVAAARATLDMSAPPLLADPFRIEPEHLKVRKSLWDWLVFRRMAAVRRRIFGPPDALDREVSVVTKQKRLGELGRQVLEERILSELSRLFPSEAQFAAESLMTRYIETYGKDLRDTLRAGRDKDAARKAALKQRIEDHAAILRRLAELNRQAAGALAEIATLGRKYHSHSRVTDGGANIEDRTLKIEH